MESAARLCGNTSGQKYVAKLGEALNYGADRVYDLLKTVPDIRVYNRLAEGLTSYDIAVSFGAIGGQMRIPFAPGTGSVVLCSGEWNRVQVGQLALELKRPYKTNSEATGILRDHPYGVFGFPPNVSGKPFGLICRIKS